jgi:hypothetical protein
MSVYQGSKYACSMGGRKGQAPEYISCLWVGWLLQHQTIDVPACQGVLVWDGVCQVGVWDSCAHNRLYKSDICAFCTHVCDVEGCGLIADVPNLLIK